MQLCTCLPATNIFAVLFSFPLTATMVAGSWLLFPCTQDYWKMRRMMMMTARNLHWQKMFESYNFYFIIISVLLSVLLGGVFFPLDYYSSHGDAERLILPGFKRLVRLLDPGSLLLPSKSNSIYSIKINYRVQKSDKPAKITLAAIAIDRIWLYILKHLRQFAQSDWFLPVFISHDRNMARGALGMFHTHAPGPRLIH